MKTETEQAPTSFSYEPLRFKRVEVMASGILYRGVFIGADENDLYIKGDMRWLILPLERVSSLRLEGERRTFRVRDQKTNETPYPTDEAD